ncbi:helix-turn-helix domain-containing protein [Oecophyllibacter saccharovorans]|uniref:Helix-turn-helix domain-containing protein n=1 Tax=Oecophyllibacter saccharovorans TaxID=2558360 RepID=A0A506UQW1_9PROT|nr:helix-turn-helix domain-containing protein [Oecophyllibacter saccharovorans]TPW35736.1 helix-turn-helix domain-containing protein [Oecophyllibacter saccharovorans]
MAEQQDETQFSGNARVQSEGQPQIGTLLRKRREELDWDIDEIAAHLKIRPVYLQALEEDAYEKLPERAYAVGYLKAYATLLGLDAGGLAVSFSRDALAKRAALQTPQLSFPEVPNERRFPLSVLLLLGAGVIGGAYGVWYHYAGHEMSVSAPLQQAAPGGASGLPTTSADLPQQTASSGAAPMPLSPAPVTSNPVSQPGSVSPSSPVAPAGSSNAASPESAASTATAMAAPTGSETVGQSVPDLSAEDATGGHDAPSMPDQLAGSSGPQTTAASAQLQTGAQGLMVHALKDSWLQVKDHSGKVVFSQTLKGGDNWIGDPENAPYMVTAGNAGGIVFRSGPVTSAPLGASGRVRRNVSVTPQAVQAGQFGHSELTSEKPTLDQKGEAQ